VPSPRSTPLLLVLCLTVFLALQCAVHLAAVAVVAHEKPFRSAALALRHDVGAVGRADAGTVPPGVYARAQALHPALPVVVGVQGQ
jgi:hypothetical protein